jgi:hypothetical protein
VQSSCKQSKGLLTLEKFQDCTYLEEPFVPQFWFCPENKGSSLRRCDGSSRVPRCHLLRPTRPARKTQQTRIFCGKSFIIYFIRKTPNRENGPAAYGVTAPDSLLVHHPITTPQRWAVTRREFTLALAHKACLLVRHSGSQHHLIMAIAHGMALHNIYAYVCVCVCVCIYIY